MSYLLCWQISLKTRYFKFEKNASTSSQWRIDANLSKLTSKNSLKISFKQSNVKIIILKNNWPHWSNPTLFSKKQSWFQYLKRNSSKYFYWFWRKICFQNRREICTNMRLYRCYLRLIFNKTLRINYFCKRVSNFKQSCKTTSGKISLTCRYRNCLQTKIPWFDNKWRKFWKI